MDVIDTVRNTLSVYADNDVRALLVSDHEAICDLAQRLVDATTAAGRHAIIERLRPLLTAHARAEETVYAALTKVEASPAPRVAGYEGGIEHHLVDVALAGLAARIDAPADLWTAHARVLHDLVDRHICDEENKTFEEVGERFSIEEREALAADFERRRQTLLAQSVAA
jgi:hypothetical protein